ncbi:MAG: OmpA family protein [Candidatus Kapabacteria bacterium]|nr:OmpA family protein [Candidatus Kapabacteria bacterium]
MITPTKILSVALLAITLPVMATAFSGADTTLRSETLGSGVNSAFDDLKPVISPDGKTLFFCRKDSPENIGGGGEDIWVSELQSDGAWGEAYNIGGPLNNRGNNSVCSITPDGTSMLLLDTYSDPSSKLRSVAISTRTSGGWSAPKPVVITGFDNQSKYAEFCISNDNEALIMAIQRSDSRGNRDLYVSLRSPDGTYATPMNLGSAINSAGQEATPFLASDNTSLYFATDGREGFGEFDVFVSRRLDSTWTNWSKPENLGPAINTDDWDLSYTIPADGKYAYFVSYTNTLGYGDIFRVRLPEKVRPRPVVLLSGRVRNKKTSSPIAADIVYFNLTTGTEVGRARSANGTGEYMITLPAGVDYGLRAEAPGYVAISQNLDLTQYTEYAEIRRDLELLELEKGVVVELKNIFFDRKLAVLKPESTAELQQLVTLMRTNPTMKIEVSGHTDAIGKDSDNQQLSADRARSVMEYVVQTGGVDPLRIIARGYGETKPLASNDTEEGRAQNRRVEFTILEK